RPDEKERLAPGVPRAFGEAELAIRPVRLPPEISYPSLGPRIVEEKLSAARAAVKAAEAGRTEAGRRVEARRGQLAAFVGDAAAGASAPPLPAGALLA